MPSHRIIVRLAEEQGLRFEAADLAAMVAEKDRRYLELLDSVRPVPVVHEIASRFRGVLPMAIASGGESAVVRRTLEGIGVLEWFDAVVGAETPNATSPSPTCSSRPRAGSASARRAAWCSRTAIWEWRPRPAPGCSGSTYGSRDPVRSTITCRSS